MAFAGADGDHREAVLILFCEDPISPRAVDGAFEGEAAAARAAGLSTALVNLELLLARDALRAVARVPSDSGAAIYRGWMMRPETYASMFEGLRARGVELLTQPEAYARCHQLPGWYPVLEGETPRSVWMQTGPAVDLEAVHRLVAPFGSRALVVKDYVKSRKHEWRDACFIRSAADRSEVERVVTNFASRQGEDFAGGLVFREFVDLARTGMHPKSGMPLSNEWRAFYFRGVRIFARPYWPEGIYNSSDVPWERFDALARRIESPFFTMDVAQQADGGWTVMEVGDGQVSGLPSDSDAAALYSGLAQRKKKD